MATRQYIGARYVPKFYQNSVDGSTQWEANVVYEPLMYVTLTNGHMYISKKQVPATVGSPASNIDYWLDIGSYNGFIEQLQNEIDDINNVTIPAVQADVALKQNITDNNLNTNNKTVVGAINEIKSDVSGITTDLADKQDKTDNNLTTTNKTVVGAVNELDAKIQSLTSDVSANTDNIEKLKNHNILLMGDSFGYGVITGGVFATKGWIEYANDYLNSLDDVNCYYLLSSQASIAGNNGFASSYPFTTELADFRTANPSVDIDEIFVFAGTNDIGNESGVATGITNFCNLARNYYGDDVTINIGTIGTVINDIYTNIVPLYKQGCINNKCNFMGKLTNLYSDVTLHYSPNAHLSQAGYDFYNPYVLNYILNGDISYKFTFPLNITPETTNFSVIGNNPTFYMIVTQDYTKITIVALEAPYSGFFIEPVNKLNLNTIQSELLLGTISNCPQTIADNETLLNLNILMGDKIAANGRIYKRGNKLYIENTLKFPSVTYDSSMAQYLVYGYQEHTQIV